MEDEPITTVSSALDRIGVGRAQALLLAYCGAAWAADACETMLLSFLGPSAACAWPHTVGPAAQSLLTSGVFAGMMAGVYLLGAAADAFGRRRGFLASALLLGGAGLASAFAPSFKWLLLGRSIVGVALGGTPIAVTLFAEFAPSASRGAYLLVLQSCWTVGTMGEAVLAWAVLPRLGWRWLLALSALPLLGLLAAFPWLPESPHWLVAQRRYADAEAVLRRVARLNGCAPLRVELNPDRRRGDAEAAAVHAGGRHGQRPPRPSLEIARAAHDGPQAGPLVTSPPPAPLLRRAVAAMAAGFAAVFSPRLRLTTGLLWAVWFVNAITYYGLVLLTTSLQEADDPGRPKCTPEGGAYFRAEDFRAVLITSAAEAPGLVAAALLVDSQGRKWTLRAGLLLCAASMLGLLAGPGPAGRLALLFAARAAIEGCFCTLYVFTPEVYPTAVRSFGLALCNAFSRLGGFAAPFATVWLVEQGRAGAAEGLLGTLCLLAAGAAFALPLRDTRGKDLSQGEEADGRGREVDGGVAPAGGVADRRGGSLEELQTLVPPPAQ